MVIATIAICLLYATPNLYGEDPAVQVSAARGAVIEVSTLDKVKAELDKQELSYKSVSLENNQVLIRLNDSEQQLLASEILKEQLGQKFIVALNLAPSTPDWLQSLGAGPLKLGLDLRGGVHFLLEVDMQEALVKAQDQMLQDFRTDLREEKLRYTAIRKNSNGVTARFRDAETRDKAEKFLKSKYADLLLTDSESNGQFSLSAKMSESKLAEIKEYALQQNITIIRNRVNQLGVAEPLVQRQGADRIVVELPGVQDTAGAKEILGATATLEFRLVDNKADPYSNRVPAGSQKYTTRDGRPVVLKKQVILTGNHITGATSSLDEFSRSQVNIDLDSQGGSKMSRATKKAIGTSMATVFIEYKPTGEKTADGKSKLQKIEEVINVATIQAQLGRSFRITGLDSASEAKNLALLLRAGALVAPVQIVEERTIGPSLGKQNIENGLSAMIYGMIAIVIFMAIYYRKFGLVANVALSANIIMIIGIMSMIPGATMTLPGIAGIVLTIGMAVDANVLVFERIREELKEGRSIQQAIHSGYDNALSTIADANITTLLTAIILFAVGTGAIKGFAITLAIGIAASMFTSIIGTRAIVNFLWGNKKIDKLSI
ncbi:protein translocase subunit SecD [Moritella viscosa]|uniref:Protein translocase subunit SecD n=2 Tax=Moritella viscosa TaxID=80854 RepID=A0A1K9YRL8_9GAMM|nr:Protein export protein SecD [Moritella viscosa]SGY84421.1 Protein export protein SecD [Moritella viscosa]SGY84511.1 Protein export protein SecD [Moritella viscosa]SGY85219.1 Protein export protein SecD [Moritella viscosa]SGY85439.1 Protein export protein SecD [Moritella viscosa]